jgi:hypothetical protein
VAAKLRAQDEFDRDVTLAWHATAISVQTRNDKRVPPLRSLLSKRGGSSVPTKSDQRNMVQAFRLHLQSLRKPTSAQAV